MLAQNQPHYAPTIPIVAASGVQQLQDNLGALQVQLPPEQLAALEEASRIDYGFPHDFLAGNEIRNILYSGSFERLHNHRRVI